MRLIVDLVWLGVLFGLVTALVVTFVDAMLPKDDDE